MRKPIVLLAAAGLAAGAAACGSSTPHPATRSHGASSAGAATPAASVPQASTGPGGTINDVINNLQFNPATIHATVGQKVTWTNHDGPPHNVTYQSGPRFPNSPRILYPGHSYTITLTRPGTITYFCSIHPFMRGTIVVAK